MANFLRNTLSLLWKTASGFISEEMEKGAQPFRGWINSFATGPRATYREVEREWSDFEKKRAIHRNSVTIVTIIIFMTRGGHAMRQNVNATAQFSKRIASRERSSYIKKEKKSPVELQRDGRAVIVSNKVAMRRARGRR